MEAANATKSTVTSQMSNNKQGENPTLTDRVSTKHWVKTLASNRVASRSSLSYEGLERRKISWGFSS
jgi:hypothetical protein